jgi:Protein of unknown function (DUF1570)
MAKLKESTHGISERGNVKKWFNLFFYSIVFIFAGCVGWLSLSDERKVFFILYGQALIGQFRANSPLVENEVSTVQKSTAPASEYNEVNSTSMPPEQTAAAVSPSVSMRTIYKYKNTDGSFYYSDKKLEVTKATLVDTIQQKVLQPLLSIQLQVEDFTLPLADRQKIEIALNRSASFFSEWLGVSLPENMPLKLRIEGDWHVFERNRNQAAPRLEFATGYYLPSTKEAIIWKNKNFEQMFEVILHESIHALLHQLVPQTPLWLHEGLAEYFEMGMISGQAMTIAPQREWEKVLVSADQKGREWNMAALMNWQHADSQRMEELDLNYSMSWGVIYFLLSSRQGKEVISNCLNHLQAAPLDQQSWEKIVVQSFGEKEQDFWQLFSIWIHQKKYSHHL